MFGPNNTPSADLRLDLPPEPEPSAGSVGSTIGSTIGSILGSTIVVFSYVGSTYLRSQNQAQVGTEVEFVSAVSAGGSVKFLPAV